MNAQVAPTTAKLREYKEQLADFVQFRGEYGETFIKSKTAFFHPLAEVGRYVYESFSDDELLDILRQSGAKLPTKAVIMSVYALFIEQRFLSWSIALERAGFASIHSDGDNWLVRLIESGFDDETMRKLFTIMRDKQTRRISEETNRAYRELTPILSENPNRPHKANVDLVLKFIERRGSNLRIYPPERIPVPAKVMKRCAIAYGRAPLAAEVPEEVAFRLWKPFGSWTAACRYCGLQPLFDDTLEDAGREYRKRVPAELA
jgi:hypothetical protein